MYISKKYITIYTGEHGYDCPPKLYLDFFKLKANLKRQWKDNESFHFRLGLFDFHLSITLEWGFVERERSEEEEDKYQRTIQFINEWNKGVE